jgi:hypothetical protein
VTVDAFRSLKSICYGFAAIIYDFCLWQHRVINLSKINQDVNEKHNGNARQEGGGTNAPTQVHVMASVDNSAATRLAWVDKGDCTNNAADQRTNLPVQKPPPPLKRLRSAGNRF